MLQRRLSICKQLIDWPPTRRFFAPKLSGRQIIKKTRPSLLTYFRRRFTLHTSQQTTALHPPEGRRTEGGKGPASRWRSATQMFWLLLAAGGCITRWVPSDRASTTRSCSLAGWVNKAPSRVVATHKRPSVALVSTALPLDGMCIRNIERPREIQTLGSIRR